MCAYSYVQRLSQRIGGTLAVTLSGGPHNRNETISGAGVSLKSGMLQRGLGEEVGMDIYLCRWDAFDMGSQSKKSMDLKLEIHRDFRMRAFRLKSKF